jgi:DNA-binding MarR family transcriptional regulator
MDLKKKKIMLVLSALALLGIFIIIWYSLFLGKPDPQLGGHGAFCPRMIPNYILWLSMILVVILVVPISYYFISKNLEEKMEKNLNAISKLVDSKKNEDQNSKTYGNGNLLRLLNPNEKIVIEYVIKKNYPILQSEISRMEGMTKLKAHRAVKELQNKGLIKLETHGKTNKISLNEDLKDLF